MAPAAAVKVLVTGVTGYFGSAVAEAPQGAGHEVAGLARNDAAARLTRLGFRPVPGDSADSASVGAAADAFALHQQAPSRRADQRPGWKPRRTLILDGLRQGSCTGSRP